MRPIPDLKAGSYKQAHTSFLPLTVGNSRVKESPASLKELGSRAQTGVEVSPTIFEPLHHGKLAVQGGVWERFGEAMEEHYWSVSKKSWHLRKGKQSSTNTVYSGGGELLTSTGDIVRRRKEYFKDVLNPTETPPI